MFSIFILCRTCGLNSQFKPFKIKSFTFFYAKWVHSDSHFLQKKPDSHCGNQVFYFLIGCCLDVELIDFKLVIVGDKFGININGHLDTAMSGLFFHVNNVCATTD